MSMKMLSAVQLIEIFSAYSFVTLLLPFLVLHKKVENQRLSVKFMIYFITGNFYVMNLVFVLQLLHISNRWTLILFTLIPVTAAGILVNEIPIRRILRTQFTYIRRLADGQMGLRTLLRKIRIWIGGKLRIFGKWLRKVIFGYFPDWILVLALTALVLWIYGSNAFRAYGYCASDIPVHNYWINYMSRNHQIFVDGVYPFGFHCVIYYLHAVFGIKTYVLLRLFWVVQTLLVHYMLLAFLKACCKSKFLAYGGAGIYAASALFSVSTYTRFYSSLPQEFGMLFILPSIYFLFAYFRRRKLELENGELEKCAKYDLAGFAMSFSMTLAVHFYGTMITGLFCLGVGLGYGFRFFRKKYFVPVILAGMIGVAVAVLPMGIAFATGTPLQGSLNWGMGVLSGDGKEEDSDEETTDEEVKKEEETTDEEAKKEEKTADAGAQKEKKTADAGDKKEKKAAAGEIQKAQGENGFQNFRTSLLQPLGIKLKQVGPKLMESVDSLIAVDKNPMMHWLVYGGIGLLFLLSVLCFILRQTDDGARLLSTAFFMVFMSLLLSAASLGLPELMDGNRCSIFYCYMVPIVWVFCADACLSFILGWFRWKWILHFASLAVVVAVSGYLGKNDLIKEPLQIDALETNAAITCLTNILYENEDMTWTICSANDELRMCEDHGYHYEAIELLRRMEDSGPKANITLPTRYVYFFIEKIPLDYALSYEGSGQSVSAAGADHALPDAGGLGIYQGENRWIVMSRLYYWAKTYQEMYPNEMRVYYETDDFICYRIEQNDYNLYNFAIDYGYNMKEYEEEE